MASSEQIGTRVLIVGHDETASGRIALAMPQQQYQVAFATGISDAGMRIDQECFDAVVVDLENATVDGAIDFGALLGVFLCQPTVVVIDDFEPHLFLELIQIGAQDVVIGRELPEGRLDVAIRCAISRARIAHHDSLTGLPNRALLFDRLNHAINQAKRYGHMIAVMFIDLDRFKFINDTMGHEAGDQLLKTAAGRIRESLRDADTVARLGGDEFIAIVTNLDEPLDSANVATKIVESLSRPVKLGENCVTVSPSIGIATFPSDGESAEDLIKLADAAMYQAKQAGGGSYQFYRPDMNSDALRRIGLGVALQRAIRNAELELHYQPQLDLVSGEVVGLEALVRWRHPERGLVPPDQFIPLAEELGLMVPMGDWILDAACAQLKQWRNMGLPEFRVAVNLSAHQFNSDNLLAHVLASIDRAGLQASDLELELTESSVMRDPESTASTLRKLSDAGVRIAIDDFGTGYSSLAYLKRFPLDALKIDRSFVRDIATDQNDAAIVKTIISLAEHLGLHVVAEGVETEEHLGFLQSNGCRFAQGFLLSRPVPSEEIPGQIEDLSQRYGRGQAALRYAT